MVYRCLHVTALWYPSESCTLVADVASRRRLQSVFLDELMVPRHKLSSAAWRAFTVTSASVWNSLANYLLCPTLLTQQF